MLPDKLATMSEADGGGTPPVAAAAGPVVRGAQVTFRVADPGWELQEVRLCQELWRPRDAPAASRVSAGDGPAASRVSAGDAWTLELPPPAGRPHGVPAAAPPGGHGRPGGGVRPRVHRNAPDAFGALFLQSGSFFQERLDPQESWRSAFAPVCAFVAGVLAGPGPAEPPPATLACGTAEENLANNRAVRDALRAQGYRVRLAEVGDAHNWTAWRDAFDPYLLDLLREVWPCDAIM
jgi:hypothetical protein